jgi:hypothetical protein
MSHPLISDPSGHPADSHLKDKAPSRREIARRLLQMELEKLPPDERRIVEQFIDRGSVARHVMREFDERLTFGERLADRVAAFGGSWKFILIFVAFLIMWMIVNSFVLVRHAFDSYPYNALASTGQHDEARQLLAQLCERAAQSYVSSYDLAVIHVALGETDEACAQLEIAYEERSYWMSWLKVEPRLDPLRGDARFT